jgi:iron complex outermembrane receptor protein
VLPGPTEIEVLGNPNFESEHDIAYEVGFRAQPIERLSFDIASFVNNYSGLESSEALPSFLESESGLHVLVHPLTFGNKLHGTTEGVELSAKWKVTNRWTLSPGYSFLEMHLHTGSTSLDTTSVADAQGSNPGHQAQLRSHLEMTHGVAWDLSSYFVGALPAQFIPSYTRLDSQLTWKLAERLQLNLVGQNLLRDHHPEFNNQFQSVNTSQVKRSAYAKLTWQF